MAEESCVGLAYAGDNIVSRYGILAEVLRYNVSCTLKICSMPSSSSSESPTPGSLQGTLDSVVDLTLLFDLMVYVIVVAQDLGWIKKTLLGNRSQNVSKGEIVLIFTG